MGWIYGVFNLARYLNHFITGSSPRVQDMSNSRRLGECEEKLFYVIWLKETPHGRDISKTIK
jgi:hypothetical protein